MSLEKKLRDEMQKAMKEGDRMKLSVLRGIVSAITNELVAQGKKPTEELPDKDVISVLKRQLKQRKESRQAFIKGNRPELAKKEEEEMTFIEPYMPQMASESEIREAVDQKMKEFGMHPDNESQKGALIGAVMKEFDGGADGALVKKVVDEVFGAR